MLGAGKLNDWETCRQWRAAKQTRPKKEDVGKKPSGKDAVKVGVSRRHIYIYGASRESASRRADVNHSKDFAVNLTSNAHESDYCDQSMYILLIGKPFCGTASPLRF